MNSTYKHRHAIWQRNYISFLLPFFILLTSVITLLAVQITPAQAATSDTLNFQGRLLTNTGGLVPDGSYNIEFKIYDDPTAGTNWWTENLTGGNAVTVKNGYFSVYLGNVTPFASNVPWDQDLWMTMNVNADGEMTPRFKLTAVPYAFRAGALVDSGGNAKTADDLIQKSPSTIQAVNSALAAIRLNQTGAGSLLQLQGDGTDVFTVDKTGNTVLGAGITVGNSSSTTAGTIRWNGSAFQGYNGSSWTSLGSSAVMPFVSKTKIVSETQNIGNNPTATLQPDDELTFSIGANETWNYRFLLQITMNATPDVKFSVSAPVGATCANGVSDFENSISVANLGCGVSSGNIAGLTGNDVYEVSGSITNGANAGTVTLNWAQNTANAANTIVLAGSYVEASRSVGGSSADVAFIQGGNSFGALAVLGTNDANGLSFETNGIERMQIQSGGDIQAKDDLIANRVTTGVTGTTSGTGTNTTTLTLAADTFNVNDVVFIDNVTQDYYTRITVDPGTGSYTVSPAVTFANARTVTAYTVQNIGATTSDYANQANRFFQGYFLGGIVVGAGSTTIGDGSINSTTDLTIQSDGGNVILGGGLTVTGAITGDASGLTNISGASIDGSTLTSLNASNVSTGTLADARLSTNVTLQGNTFNGINQLVRLGASGELPALNGAGLTSLTAANLTGAIAAIDGSALTSLNASNIASGTLDDGRLSANVALLSGIQTFSGAKTFSAGLTISGGNIAAGSADITTTGQISGTTILGNGAGLTNLEAGDIATGTLADGRLSANVTLLGNTFNGNSQLVQLTGTGALPSLDGSGLTNLNAANLSGTLPGLSGVNLTSLNGSNIASGTLDDGRLSSNVALLSGIQTFTGAKTFSAGLTVSGGDITQTGDISATGEIAGATIVGDGAGLTGLNASNIGSGTLADGRLSANVALLSGTQTFTGLKTFGAGLSITSGDANVTGDISATGEIAGATIVGDGAGLTGLNASNIGSGTLADVRLSANVALLSGTQTFGGLKTFSGGLVLGQSTITSLATVSRAVSLPDEAGTICLSNSDTCGYLRLASGSLQIDASNNDVLAVNKTSATGNLINLQRSGGAVFTVANTGALQIQSTSTAALDIRNAGGTSYFTVDTNTGSVVVGSGTAAANGVLFVLDTRTADPGGVAGGMYYNSTLGKNRCYENATWKDCVTDKPVGLVSVLTNNSAAIANTEAVAISYTIPANSSVVGDTYRIRAYATRTGANASSPIIRVRVGTTTLIGNVAATLTGLGNTTAATRVYEGFVTIRSIGVGGTIGGGLTEYANAAGTLTSSTAPVTIDTTANKLIELTMISGQNSNSYTFTYATIEKINND